MKLKLLILLFGIVPILSNAQNQTSQPIFQIGSGTSRIWALDFRNEESARVDMSDFSKSNYLIKEFTVTVLSDRTKTYKTLKNVGNKLNDEVKNLFFTLKSNDTILIDGIAVTDPLGKTIYLSERIFKVR